MGSNKMFDFGSADLPKRLPPAAIPARLLTGADGSVRLSVVRGSKAVIVESGPGYARILQRNEEGWRERVSSPAAASAAHVASEIAVAGGRVVRRVRSVFIDGTVRKDLLEVEGARLTRSAEWSFPGDVTARAEYTPDGRSLKYTNQNGDALGRFVTAIQMGPIGYTSRTEQVFPAEGDHTVIGSKSVHPGSSTTIIGPTIVGLPGHETPGPMSYSTVTKDLDGTTRMSQVIPDAHFGSAKLGLAVTGSAGSYSVIGPDGSMSNFTQIWGTDQNGQTFVGTVNTSFGTDGTSTTSRGVAGTTQDGGFFTVTETGGRDGSSQRSSFAADGQGNSSETTVTYNADGSFTISTTSTDSDGNTTTNTGSYDKEGNPTGGDGDGDGGGGGGGDGSYPADDGSDPAPRSNWHGSLNTSLDSWLDKFSGPLGGSRSVPTPRGDLGDPVPLLNSACEDDIQGKSTSGERWSGSSSFDLRPYMRRERDPENDPRALIEALGAIAGIQSTRQLSQLAGISF